MDQNQRLSEIERQISELSSLLSKVTSLREPAVASKPRYSKKVASVTASRPKYARSKGTDVTKTGDERYFTRRQRKAGGPAKHVDGQRKLGTKRYQSLMQVALDVMMELRLQPGIIDPSQSPGFYVINFKKSEGVCVGRHEDMVGQVLGPAYATAKYATMAIEAVGADRVEKAFEALLFIKS